MAAFSRKFFIGRSWAAAIAALALLSPPAFARQESCRRLPAQPGASLTAAAAIEQVTCGVETIPALTAALKQPDWQQRAIAAYLLGQLGPEAAVAVPALTGGVEAVGALQDEHPVVRFAAAKALGQIGAAAAVDPLVNALGDSDESVRASAIVALLQVGGSTRSGFPQLFEALSKRGIIFDAYPDYSSSPADLQRAGLMASLEDGNWLVRRYAANSLIELGQAQPDRLPEISLIGLYPSGLVRGLNHDIFRQIGPETLVNVFESSNPDARRIAAQALGEIGSIDSVADILSLLNDPDELVRSAAAAALGQIGSAAAVPALLELLQEDSSKVRQDAAIALGRLTSSQANPDVVAALAAALPSDIGASAAQALGQLGSEAAVPALATAMQSADIDRCRSAALALGQIGSPTAVSVLIEALQRSDELPHHCALWALGQVPAGESSEALSQARRQLVPLFIASLQSSQRQNPEPVLSSRVSSSEVRRAAASALALVDVDVVPALIETVPAEIGVPAFIEIVESTSATGTPRPRATYRDYREHIGPADDRLVAIAAAYIKVAGPALAPTITAALDPKQAPDELVLATLLAGYVADEATLLALIDLLSHPDSGVRQTASSALGRQRAEAAVSGLIQLLQAPDPWTPYAAAQALGQIDAAQAVPALITALNHPEVPARAEAAIALGHLSSAAALPALAQSLRDEDWEVRRNAATAIGQVGGDAAVPLLMTALEDSHFYVSYAAAVALGKLGPTAVPALLAVLEPAPLPPVLQVALQDYGIQRRRAAAFALGLTLHPTPEAAAIEGLKAVALSPQEHPEVRRMAAAALAPIGLAPIGDPTISPQLLDCQGVDPDIHRYAGQCVYEDVFQGGDGLYEIYESLRKLLRGR